MPRSVKPSRPATVSAQRAVASARDGSPFVVGFYLVPEFPMMAFAAAIEPLRAANRLTGRKLFEWHLYSRDGKPVRASNGIDIPVGSSIRDNRALDLLLVCAGRPDAGARDRLLVQWLRTVSRVGVSVGGISLGAYALAHAGLLDGRRCTLHWESLAAFAEQFPRAHTSGEIFILDGDRFTCSGGIAALDMMLQLITASEGRALANDVSEQFIHPRIRDTRDRQRMAIQARLGVSNPKLGAAIGLMEGTADEPRDVRQIAADVGLSPRQLERLFAKYLHASPSRHYLELRLDKARELLLQTSKPVLDVAVACGFASASHFSRCYRSAYGRRPSDERAAALGDGRGHKHDRIETADLRGRRQRAPRLTLR